MALSRCRCQLRDALDDIRALQRLLNELVGLLGLSIDGQCADRLEQFLLQVIRILLIFMIMITMMVIIIFSLDLLTKLQLTQGNDADLLLLFLDLGKHELHRLHEQPIFLSFLLQLLIGAFMTFLAEGVD